MKYDLFISYSHGEDRQIANAVRYALHRFGRPFYKLRALQVFCDNASLSTSAALWPSILAALSSSRYFLLIASPSAATSKWIQLEVTEWLSRHRSGTLLLALTKGDICWDAEKNDFDWQRTTALPYALKGAFPGEPFFCDLRWTRDDAQLSSLYGVQGKQLLLSLRNPRFLDSIATLAAAVHGRPKDYLVGEDVREHSRFRRVALAVIALLAAALFVVTLLLFEIEKARRDTEKAGEQAVETAKREIALRKDATLNELEFIREFSDKAIIAPEEFYWSSLKSLQQEFETDLSELEKTVGSEAESQLLADVKRAWKQYRELVERRFMQSRLNPLDSVDQLAPLDSMVDRLELTITELYDARRNALRFVSR